MLFMTSTINRSSALHPHLTSISSSLRVRQKVSDPHKTRKIIDISVYVSMIRFLDRQWELKSQPRKPCLESSPMWKFQISQKTTGTF